MFSHLIAERLDTQDPQGLLHACQNALAEVEGSYAFVVISSAFPDQIFAARQGSPMVVGVGQDESLIASDVSALLSYTLRSALLRCVFTRLPISSITKTTKTCNMEGFAT